MISVALGLWVTRTRELFTITTHFFSLWPTLSTQMGCNGQTLFVRNQESQNTINVLNGESLMFCVVIVLLFSTVFCSDQGNTSQIYAKEFCRLMKSSREPRVLIYNRIPKCGSQTMTNVLHHIQHLDPDIDQAAKWRQYWWPRDMDTNDTLTSLFSGTVKKRLALKAKVRITGHWYWHNFDAVRDFGLEGEGDVEYINILRECSPRFKSQLLFDLFDTQEAKAAAATGAIAEHQRSLLYRNISVRACIEDISCLDSVFRRRVLKDSHSSLTGMMVMYLSGTNKMKQEGHSYLNGAIQHLNRRDSSDTGYSVLGFLEHFEESLELLECAYPSFFRHARDIYLRQRTHLHRSSVQDDPGLYRHPNFERVLQPLCGLGDSQVYSEALDQFWSKLFLVRKDRSKCCRVAPQFNESLYTE